MTRNPIIVAVGAIQKARVFSRHRGRVLWPIVGLLMLGVCGLANSAPPIRIAVSRFAGETEEMPIAASLAARLAQRPIERVIAPDAFLAKAEYEPRAALIRQWAYNASVDTVVVGRVVPSEAESPDASNSSDASDASDASGDSGYEVEVVLRSGHSGAEAGRHRVSVASRPDLDAAADRLAVAILGDLGYLPSDGIDAAPHRDPRSPEPPIFVPVETNASSGGSGDTGSNFQLGKLREDAPIEINAEEAEIVDRGENRKLIFQRNVRVRQGDIRLESDLVEAEYRKGEPEPDRLIARGSVQVDQGYRRAKCDRAVYMRLEQTLSCEGHAELVQGCDVVRGDSIVFDLAGDEAHVVGAASIVIRPSDEEGQVCASPEGTP
jgi:lipopolysaccharide transport protein LptA